MQNNPNQPQENDVVLGSQASASPGSVVLGGLESVKRRLASTVIEQRVAALSEALKYGEAGLDLVIQALTDKSERVEKAAYLLLQERTEPKAKQALLEYNPDCLFCCLYTLSKHLSKVNFDSVNSITISPDGQFLAIGRMFTIEVWHLPTREQILNLYDAFNNCIVFSPDGQTLASGNGDGTIKFWNPRTGELLYNLSNHPDYAVTSIAFSADGQILASGSLDNTVKLVWSLGNCQLIRTLKGHASYVTSIAFSPDRNIFASSGSQTTKVWNLCSGELLSTIEWPAEIAWHQKFLEEVCVGEVCYPRVREERPSDGIRSVAISPDGQTLASSNIDNTIWLWDLNSSTPLHHLQGHLDRVNSVAFSSDGQTLASGSNDNTIKLWNLSTGKLLQTLEGHSGAVNCVAFSPDGHILLSGSSDTTIKAWKCNLPS
ncbi:MAG TPA: hypothetical protein V6C85_09475 [Allocoleopsis sp.]